ncbi:MULTISPECIES: DsrE/DsrF/DrsH-like family protein [unclassified Propioniciclava]|uniref:DsrE/DsrF/DrsH-like family protein n=1 Tax=unclassified Propioniciclava TaxID=2642922 RepID=UPI001FB73F17|nr:MULTISPECIES: DsrE/DsrF/DrsH-like family protein [unclassified Propioniciclava]
MTEILETPIIPDFGDNRPAQGATRTKGRDGDRTECPVDEPQEQAAPAASGYSGPRKICFIASKGNLDMAYPALIMANAALGEGIETHIFFTFWGFDLVTERTMDDLKFTMVGNTAMHLPQAPGMSMPQVMGLLPGMTGMATKMMKKQMDDLDIPGVREFLDIIVASGGHLWGCKLTFDMNGLARTDLYDGVEDVISAADFIELSEGAQVIFV